MLCNEQLVLCSSGAVLMLCTSHKLQSLPCVVLHVGMCGKLLLCCAMHVTDIFSMSAGSSHHSPDHADAQKQLQKNAASEATHRTQDPTHSGTRAATGGLASGAVKGGQQPDPSQQPVAGLALTSSQEAAQSSDDDSSALPRVPPELRAITAFLRDKERLKTAGLFVNSADAAMLWAMHQPAEQSAAESNREPKAGCALAVKPVREALDRGQEVLHQCLSPGL